MENVPRRHQLKIVRQNLRLTCWGCKIMGGPNHREGATLLRLYGHRATVPDGCTCREPRRSC
jgi:hypothetical protein